MSLKLRTVFPLAAPNFYLNLGQVRRPDSGK
jgi:hypothetical protein